MPTEPRSDGHLRNALWAALLAVSATGCMGLVHEPFFGVGADPSSPEAPGPSEAAPGPPVPASPDAGGGGPEELFGPPGAPGCGFESAAFCETFDQPATQRGRSHELDATRWSLTRGLQEKNTVLPIGAATVSDCRAGVPATVLPPQDTLICPPTTTGIPSAHLLVAVAAQNYGTSSYRIRQPFDFEGRTGTLRFDVDATVGGPLIGWFSISVTEDPTPTPSFSLFPGAGNFEGGIIPKNGVELHLFRHCGNGHDNENGLGLFTELQNHLSLVRDIEGTPCVKTQRGRLNRFELKVSKTKVELLGTDASADGTAFGALKLLVSKPVSLPFERGYVQLTTHNHASKKYSAFDSVLTRWDNVGFDGPVVRSTREVEVPDSLVAQGETVGFGYFVEDSAAATARTFTLRSVELPAGSSSAALSFTMLYQANDFDDPNVPLYALNYRLNGKAWRTYPLSDQEKALLKDGVTLGGDASGISLTQGALGHHIAVPIEDLVPGDNVLELATVNVPMKLKPVVSNVTLIVKTP